MCVNPGAGWVTKGRDLPGHVGAEGMPEARRRSTGRTEEESESESSWHTRAADSFGPLASDSFAVGKSTLPN